MTDYSVTMNNEKAVPVNTQYSTPKTQHLLFYIKISMSFRTQRTMKFRQLQPQVDPSEPRHYDTIVDTAGAIDELPLRELLHHALKTIPPYGVI